MLSNKDLADRKRGRYKGQRGGRSRVAEAGVKDRGGRSRVLYLTGRYKGQRGGRSRVLYLTDRKRGRYKGQRRKVPCALPD
jgi:hypothetical protein